MQSLVSHKGTEGDYLFFKTPFLSDQGLSDGRIAELPLNDLAETDLVHEEQFPFVQLLLVYFGILITKAFILLRISFDIDGSPSFLGVADRIKDLGHSLLGNSHAQVLFDHVGYLILVQKGLLDDQVPYEGLKYAYLGTESRWCMHVIIIFVKGLTTSVFTLREF